VGFFSYSGSIISGSLKAAQEAAREFSERGFFLPVDRYPMPDSGSGTDVASSSASTDVRNGSANLAISAGSSDVGNESLHRATSTTVATDVGNGSTDIGNRSRHSATLTSFAASTDVGNGSRSSGKVSFFVSEFFFCF